MVVLHRGVVVIQHSQVIMGLDQEVVVHTPVFIIVDDGRQEGHEKAQVRGVLCNGIISGPIACQKVQVR